MSPLPKREQSTVSRWRSAIGHQSTKSLDPGPSTLAFSLHPLVRVVAVWIVSTACLSGCLQEMANQPRVDVMEPSPFLLERPQSRQPVSGTIAQGQIWEQTPVTTGRVDKEFVNTIPIDVTAEILQRGRERYHIFCQHCHGPAGYGDGMVVQRGFPAPPSFHSDRLRAEPDGKIFVTITDGFGRMPALGKRITFEDRWAITAYVRALQLSQHMPLDSLPEEDRQQLESLGEAVVTSFPKLSHQSDASLTTTLPGTAAIAKTALSVTP